MTIINSLYKKLQVFFDTYPLGVAGRIVYFNPKLNMLILAVHTTSPEKTLEVGQKAWECLPDIIKEELEARHIGFAIRQI